MKIQIAKLRHLKMAPRKVRLVADVLRGLSVNEAEAQLLMSPRRVSLPLMKLLRQAVANAKHNSQLNPDQLFIKEIRVDNGPMLERYLPRAMGRASHIQKKSSHITLVLAESDKLASPRFKIVKAEKISKREKAERVKKTKGEKGEKGEKEKELEKPKPQEKPGFMRRIFRRKSI